MPLIDVATAKLHLRVTHDSEDAAIEAMVAAAAEQATSFLGRNVYESQGELDAAVAAAPTILSTASTTYDDALDASWSLTTAGERIVTREAVSAAWRDAQDAYTRTTRGIVINDSIRTAILLITASLWEHRGDEDAVEGIPQAARAFLWPFRIGIGV